MSTHIKYKKGYKYQLAEDYHTKTSIRPDKHIKTDLITLTTGGNLFIKKYYAWDGPSGPTIDTKSTMRASLEHDALYELMRKGLLDQKWRKEADNQLEQTCIVDGMPEVRADLWEAMVNVFAGNAANPKNKKEIYIAP